MVIEDYSFEKRKTINNLKPLPSEIDEVRKKAISNGKNPDDAEREFREKFTKANYLKDL